MPRQPCLHLGIFASSVNGAAAPAGCVFMLVCVCVCLLRSCINAACVSRALAFFVNLATRKESVPFLVATLPTVMRVTTAFVATDTVRCSWSHSQMSLHGKPTVYMPYVLPPQRETGR